MKKHYTSAHQLQADQTYIALMVIYEDLVDIERLLVLTSCTEEKMGLLDKYNELLELYESEIQRLNNYDQFKIY